MGTKARASGVLSSEQILSAAVEIGDRDGIESLTIRRLASVLEIGTMTLYGYFRSKDEILDGIADHVLGRLKVPASAEQTPQAVARSVAVAIFDMMRAHPSVVNLLSSRATISEESLRVAMEDVIGALRAAGFSDEGAVRGYALIMTYCLGFANYQMPRPWGPAATSNVEELRRQRKFLYASLPLPEFTNLVELSDLATSMPSDEQFHFGLDCLIDGLIRQPGIVRKPASRRPIRQAVPASELA